MQKSKGSRSKIVKIVFFTGKTGYTLGRRTRTRPDPYPRVWVGSGIPAGTGRPAHLWFRPVTVADVTCAVQVLPDKQCSSDRVSTHVLKSRIDMLAPFLVELFNRSLFRIHGSVPIAFKAAYITPLLKTSTRPTCSHIDRSPICRFSRSCSNLQLYRHVILHSKQPAKQARL